MNLPQHVVIFVRAPQLGAVKRRLAVGLGAGAAWRFYRDTTAALLRKLAREPRLTLWLAVTPDRFVRQGRFWPCAIGRRPLRRIGQGAGDLGARMGRVFRHLPRGPVVIIGSDIPGIDVAALRAAFGELRAGEAVIGPAGDGGYWLIGLRRRPMPHRHLPGRLFADVRWSTEHALADTLASLPKDVTVARLHRLDDVDDADDWRIWRAQRRSGLRSSVPLSTLQSSGDR